MTTMGQIFESLVEEKEASPITDKQVVAVSNEAVKALARQFDQAGFKTDVLSSDGWGISSATVTIGGVRIPVMIGVQNLPKGVQMHVEFQSPMSRADAWDDLGPELFTATKAASGIFDGKGTRVDVGVKGRHEWPYVWIYPGDNVADDVRSFPGRVEAFAKAVVAKLRKNKGQ
jgi:hypothetical protein